MGAVGDDSVLIYCDKCRRPVARLGLFGGVVRILGSINAEGDMRGVVRGPNIHGWRAKIWDVSRGGASWDTDGLGGNERFKLVCVGRRCRVQRIVPKSRLDAQYFEARRLGNKRVRLSVL
jgi:hypothetical protein